MPRLVASRWISDLGDLCGRSLEPNAALRRLAAARRIATLAAFLLAGDLAVADAAGADGRAVDATAGAAAAQRPVTRAPVRTAGGRLTVSLRSLDELRFERLVRQSWDVSCGAAALSTVLTYDLARPVSEYAIATTILRRVDPGRVRARGGFSLLDLKRVAQALGLRAEGYSGMTLEEAVAGDRPAILPVRIRDFDHFVVLRGVAGNRVFLGDPAFGNITVSRREFDAIWKSRIGFFVGDRPLRAHELLAQNEVGNLRIPDVASVGRLLRGAGPAPLTRGRPGVP